MAGAALKEGIQFNLSGPFIYFDMGWSNRPIFWEEQWMASMLMTFYDSLCSL